MIHIYRKQNKNQIRSHLKLIKKIKFKMPRNETTDDESVDDFPKCVRCSIELSDDFQLIFDDTGLELELPKLLGICFDIDIKVRLNEVQALCDECLNELIDTYDVIKRDEEDQGKSPTTTIVEDVTKRTVTTKDSGPGKSPPKNDSVKEIIDFNVNKNILQKYYIKQKSDNNQNSDNIKRTRQSDEIEILQQNKKIKSNTEIENNQAKGNKFKTENTESELDDEEVSLNGIKRPENFSDIGKKIEHSSDNEEFNGFDIEEDTTNEGIKFESNEADAPEDGKKGKHDSEDEFPYVDYLEDFDKDIDTKEYKSKALQSKFQDVCFPEGLQCRLCTKTVESHVDMINHTVEEHCVEDFAYPCIIDGDCESLSSMQDLSFHLVFKHYDLETLVIYCKCPDCSKRFNNFYDFNKHSCYQKRHISRTIVDCDQCGRTFSSNKRYRFHLQFHLEKRRPKACFICDKLFRDQDEFFEHIMYSHEKNLGHLCIRCDRTFTTAENYTNHAKVHKFDRPYSCVLCSKSYLHKHYLSDHMISNHGAESPFKCHICGKFFLNAKILNKHLVSHNRPKPAEVICCSACGFVAENEKEAESHLEQHEDNDAYTFTEIVDKVYCCEYCESAYCIATKLIEHRDAHENKVYCCAMCPLSFDDYKELKSHKLTHSDYVDKRKTFPVMRHYVCDVPGCMKSYMQWITLKAHKKQCQYEKKFKCPKCKESFDKNSELDEHVEVIHNGFDYHCQFCEKIFHSKLAVGVHIARKHDSDQFACDSCEYSYPTEELLENHKAAMHRDLTCEKCGVVLKTRRNYQLHQRVVHEKEKRYFCKFCNKGFFKNCDAVSHEEAVHMKIKKYKCELCPYLAVYKETLTLHMRAHRNETPYVCDICKRGFRKKFSLKNHLKRHNNQRDYKCPYEGCNYAYVEKTNLTQHLRQKHGDENPGKTIGKKGANHSRFFFNVPKSDTFIDDDDGLDICSDEELEIVTSIGKEFFEDEEHIDDDDPEEVESQGDDDGTTIIHFDTEPAVVVEKNYTDHDYIVDS